MAKPKITWKPEDISSFPAHCAYDGVKLSIYQEMSTENGDPKDKFRIRVRKPKGTVLPEVTFYTLKEAVNKAEAAAEALYRNLLPASSDELAELRTKADSFDEIVEVLSPIGREPVEAAGELVRATQTLKPTGLKPEQAAYEIVKLREMAAGRDPAELVGKYLDEFVRVKEHMLIGVLAAKRIRQIRNSDLCPKEKRNRIAVLLDFAKPRKARLAEQITIEEAKEWQAKPDCKPKRRYDRWLVFRELIDIAFKDYGAITKWVHDRIMELNYSAKSGTLGELIPSPIWTGLWQWVEFGQDALYLGFLSDVPIREDELDLLCWKDIKKWHGFPRWIDVSAEVAKGEERAPRPRRVRIPRRLGRLLQVCWQESGPIFGKGHLARLKRLAKQIDPSFVWPRNAFRRTMISNYVGAYGRNSHYAEQAGHETSVQGIRYLRPVDPMDARNYVLHHYPYDRLKGLPYLPARKRGGRPRTDTDVAPIPATTPPVSSPAETPTEPTPIANEDPRLEGDEIPATAATSSPGSSPASTPTEAIAVVPTPDPDKPSNPQPTPPEEMPENGSDKGATGSNCFQAGDPALIPAPPRAPDGCIDWDRVSRELPQELAKSYSNVQIGTAWAVSETLIRRKMNLHKVQRAARGQWAKIHYGHKVTIPAAT